MVTGDQLATRAADLLPPWVGTDEGATEMYGTRWGAEAGDRQATR